MVGRGDAVLEYLDSDVFEPVCGGELPKTTTETMVAIAKEIDFAMRYNQSIFVYGDYDTDGLMSMLVWKEVFYALKYPFVKFFHYCSRTHKLDTDIITQAAGSSLVIVCDTGSSVEDRNIISILTLSGSRVVVIDHHKTEYLYTGKIGTAWTYNSYEEKAALWGAEICGAYAALLVARTLCEDILGVSLCLPARVYALCAMYADQMDMSTVPARALYNVVARHRRSAPALISYLNEFGYRFTRRLFSFIIAPKLNACFRSEQFRPLNQIVSARDPYSIQLYVKELKSVHNNASKLVEPFADKFECEQIGQIMLAVVDPSEEMLGMHIENFSGLIANHLCHKHKCAVITAIKLGRHYIGSYRDFFNRPLLDDCSLFMSKAGGHPAAFGLEFSNISEVRRYLGVLSSKMQEAVGTEQLTISSKLVKTELDVATLALYNEYMTTRPKVIVPHTCRHLYCTRTTKYNKTYRTDLPLDIRSGRTLIAGETIMLEPAITKKVELRVLD